MDLLEEDNKNNNFMLIKKYFEKNEIKINFSSNFNMGYFYI